MYLSFNFMLLFLSVGCYKFLDEFAFVSQVSQFLTCKTCSRLIWLLPSLWLEVGLVAVFDLMKCLEAKSVADWLLILEILFQKEDKEFKKPGAVFIFFELWIFMFRLFRAWDLGFIVLAITCKFVWNVFLYCRPSHWRLISDFC